MQFNVYMINDVPARVALLDGFLKWLADAYSAHTFTPGFIDPLESSQQASEIRKALCDPLGVILLDVMMEGPLYDAAAIALQNEFGKKAEADTIQRERFYDAEDFEEVSEGTLLCATVAAIAQSQGSRVVLCTRQTQAPHLHGTIEGLFGKIAWTGRWDKTTATTMTSVLKPFHAEPAINDAIGFALNPDVLEQWDHDSLMKKGKDHDHNEQLRKWLALKSCDVESAKALLCPNNDKGWAVVPSTKGYVIRGLELKSAYTRLGIPFECSTVDSFRFPVQPGFPFVLAMADLYYQMGKCLNTFPPETIRLSRRNGQHTMLLDLKPKGRQGQSIDLDAFEGVYNDVLSGQAVGRHETSRRLCNVRKAKVQLDYLVDTGRQRFFDGVMNGQENVSVRFVKDANNPAIELEWSTNRP